METSLLLRASRAPCGGGWASPTKLNNKVPFPWPACRFAEARSEREFLRDLSAWFTDYSVPVASDNAALASFPIASVPSTSWRAVPHVMPQVIFDLDSKVVPQMVAGMFLERSVKDWQTAHEGLSAASSLLPPPRDHVGQAASRARLKKGCFASQLCFCTPDGQRYKKFRNKIVGNIKAAFKEPAHKSDLIRGFVVLKLSSWQVVRSDESECEAEEPTCTRYFHISMQYLKPWSPTLLEMKLSPRQVCLPPNMLLEPDYERKHMNHEGAPFCMLTEILVTLDRRLSWKLAFCTLVSHEGFLHRPFTPGVVEAMPHVTEETVVWDPTTKKRAPRRVAPAPDPGPEGHPADPAAIEDAGGGEGDDADAGGGGDAALSEDAASEPSADGESDGDGSVVGAAEVLFDLAADIGSSGTDSESAAPSALSDDYQSVSSLCLTSAEPSSDDESSGREDEDDDDGGASGVVAAPGCPAGPSSSHGSHGGGGGGRGQQLEGLDVYDGDVVRFPGAIRYSAPDKKFYATCPDKRHGRCVATRTSNPGSKKSKGRPLGFLAAWLLSHAGCLTQADHVFGCRPSKVLRARARRDLARSPNAASFFQKEAPKDDGDESEPDKC